MPYNTKKSVSGGDWPPECDCCGRQLEPGDTYFELDVYGTPNVVCDICQTEMLSKTIVVEDPAVDYPDFCEPDFHDEAFW